MTLKPCDILLTSSGSIVVKFMRLFQRDRVNWGHVAIVEDGETVIESKMTVVRVDLAKWLRSHKRCVAVRMTSLSPGAAHMILNKIRGRIGLRYGVWRIVLQMLDHFTRSNWFTRHSCNEDLQVCSSLIAWGYYSVLDFRFNGVDWQSCEPDDIEDEAERNPDFVFVEV